MVLGLHCNLSALKSPQGFLKFIQLVLGIICFCLYRYYTYNSAFSTYLPLYLGTTQDGNMFAVITMGSALIYSSIMAVCHIIDEKAAKTLMECLMSFFCGFFYLALGGLAINKNQNAYGNTQAMVFGVFCFIQTGLYILDSIFAFLTKKKSSTKVVKADKVRGTKKPDFITT